MIERILKEFKAREEAKKEAEQKKLERAKQKPAEVKRVHDINTHLLLSSGAYNLLEKINNEILRGKGRIFLVQNAQVTHTHYDYGGAYYGNSAPDIYDKEHLYSYCLLSWQSKKEYFHLMVVAEGGSRRLGILGSVDEDAKKQWQNRSRALPCQDSGDEDGHFKHICSVDFSGVDLKTARIKLEEQLADAFLRITSLDRPYKGGFGPSTLV